MSEDHSSNANARKSGASKSVAPRARSRSAARLGAVQALFQHDMESTPVAQLIHEFHNHRLGSVIDDEDFDDAAYFTAEQDFFDDLVKGTIARLPDVDATVSEKLSANWSLERLDRTLKSILRVGTYELMARADVPSATVISEYVEIAKAFDAGREAGFVNGVLDTVAKAVRT